MANVGEWDDIPGVIVVQKHLENCGEYFVWEFRYGRESISTCSEDLGGFAKTSKFTINLLPCVFEIVTGLGRYSAQIE